MNHEVLSPKEAFFNIRKVLKNGCVSCGFVLFWFGIATLIKNKVSRPESLEAEPEDGRLILNYYSNYNSLCHATFMILSCKRSLIQPGSRC